MGLDLTIDSTQEGVWFYGHYGSKTIRHGNQISISFNSSQILNGEFQYATVQSDESWTNPVALIN